MNNSNSPSGVQTGHAACGGSAWACRLPLDVFGSREPLSEPAVTRCLWILIALGVAARLIRFGLRLPLWCDEAFLSANFIDHGYGDMLRPLAYHQICPVLFLWVQLSVVKLLGFTEYTLRLFPLFCGLASMALFRHLAGRLLRGTALVLAVGIFATSYACIRYSAEIKPYSCDLLVAMGLATLFVEWWRRPQQTGWLWALAAAAPVAIGLAYPAVFVAGGISLTVAVVLWRLRASEGVSENPSFLANPLAPALSRRERGTLDSGSRVGPKGWLAWLAFNAAVGVGFLGLLFCMKGQATVELGWQRDFWAAAFPPLTSPIKLAGWLVMSHVGELMAHPLGGPKGASLLTTICFAAALLALVRRRQATWVLLCLAPLAVNFVAAAMHRYPYAGHVRMALYYTPLVCIMAGLGAAVLLAALARNNWLPRLAMGLVAALALIPLGTIVRDFAAPGKSDGDIRARDFARWFWFEMARDAELVCLKADWHEDFYPPNYEWGYSTLYVCNQRIYSPRLARREAPQLQRVSAQWPLRCVEYRPQDYPRDEAAYHRWMTSMQERYVLRRQDQYPISHFGRREHDIVDLGYVQVYEFVPKTPGPGGSLSALAK